jgi:hypothetical protein
MTRTWPVLVAALACTLACGGGETPAGNAAPKADAPKADTKGAPTVAAGDFGVPECDEYVKKYVACIDSKVPDAARPGLKTALDQMKTTWQKAAATPEGRAALATGCTQALAASKAAMAAYSCQW